MVGFRIRLTLAAMLFRLVEQLGAWTERRRDRRLLASLDDGDLRDIGIERATAERDSTTSFWRLP